MNVLDSVGFIGKALALLTLFWVFYHIFNGVEDDIGIIKESAEHYQSYSWRLHDEYKKLPLLEKVEFNQLKNRGELFDPIYINPIKKCYKKWEDLSLNCFLSSNELMNTIASHKYWPDSFKETFLGCIVIEEDLQVCRRSLDY